MGFTTFKIYEYYIHFVSSNVGAYVCIGGVLARKKNVENHVPYNDKFCITKVMHPALLRRFWERVHYAWPQMY